MDCYAEQDSTSREASTVEAGMAGTVPAFEAHSGEIVVIERVTIHELIRKARELARRTRDGISNAGLQPDDFEGIAQHFGLTLCWAQLPNNNPGCYLKRERKIGLLSRDCQSSEQFAG